MHNDNPTSAVLSLWQQNLWRSPLNNLTLSKQPNFEIANLSDIEKGIVPNINTDGRYWIAPIVAEHKNDKFYWIPMWVPVCIQNKSISLSLHALPWVPYIHNEKTFGNAPLQGQMHIVDAWLSFDWLNEENQLAFDSWQEAYESIQGLFDWQSASRQQDLELVSHAFIMKEPCLDDSASMHSLLCQRYATLTDLSSKEIMQTHECLNHASILCAAPSGQALNLEAFNAAIHALLMEEGEFIALKNSIEAPKKDFIDALAHAHVAYALVKQQAIPSIWQYTKGKCDAFHYQLKSFSEAQLKEIYSQYQNAIQLAVSVSTALASLEDGDGEYENDSSSLSALHEKDEHFEKKLQRLLQLQSELADKMQRKFMSWILPSRKLRKEELNYFCKMLKLSSQSTQQDLVAKLSEKIQHVKVSRTKIQQQLIDVEELKIASQVALQQWESWFESHFSGLGNTLSFEEQVLRMQNHFAHQIYALIFEKSGWQSGNLSACDLLIINDAQNLLPQEVVAFLAKAKKALILGDNQDHHALPVMSSVAQEWELKQYGLNDDELLEEMQFKGMLPSFGNAFSVALANSTYQTTLEHGITISTLSLGHDDCIEKQYHAISEQGDSQVRDNQLVNEQQALFIVHWLETGPLTSHLANTVIITPFVAQKELLCRKLKEHRLNCEVLTFHELTDKQWQNVVFSPVYCQKDQRPFVFDQGENMLYSLSARSSKNIWVVGDLNIFDPRMHSPSGNLAKKLFSPETELIE